MMILIRGTVGPLVNMAAVCGWIHESRESCRDGDGQMEMARRIPGTLCCALVLVRPELSLTGGDRSM